MVWRAGHWAWILWAGLAIDFKPNIAELVLEIGKLDRSVWMMKIKVIWSALVAGVLLSSVNAEQTEPKKEEGWIQLFNGKDLTGWTPKFKGQDLGVNYKDTFKVQDGKLVVDYSKWEKWDGAFGHLFYEKEYGHYILRAEYRFVGQQVPGGPGWATRNNGFMIHGQTAQSMTKDQEFPNSIEVQLLGGLGSGNRSTLSICTPGTQIEKDGQLIKAHVIPSTEPTIHGDEWVAVEIEVKGSEVIRHKYQGKTVMEYNKPQLDDGTLLEKGTISIQAETAPIEFRKIELKPLDEGKAK